MDEARTPPVAASRNAATVGLAAGPSERWAVILGATSGNGLEIARAVAAAPGLSIFGAHRGHWPDHAAELQREVAHHGRRCALHVGDAGTWDGTQKAADALAQVAAPQSVALFVHSIANASLGMFLPGAAGGGESAAFRPYNEHNFHKTMDSMANSFAWWARALVERDLLAPGARLLGLTNPIADSLIRNFGLITAAKAALEVYVKHLAWELGPRGCRVNLLNFGTVDTPAVRRAFTPEKWRRFCEVVARAIPAGRMLTTREVGLYVAHWLQHESEWFNGATIDFTGGQSQSLLDALLFSDWVSSELHETTGESTTARERTKP